MSKVIAVQKGLEDLSRSLEKKGYRTINLEGANEPIDAIIYSQQKGYTTPDDSDHTEIAANNQFVMMLNADELNQKDIINRIDNIKTY